jgi:hypothetical protein
VKSNANASYALWLPDRRWFGGVQVCGSYEELVRSERFVLEHDDGDGTLNLASKNPRFEVTVIDGTVVSISSREQCLLDGHNLIGMAFIKVQELLGEKPWLTDSFDDGRLNVYELDGLQIWVPDRYVSAIRRFDYSAID